MNGAYPHYSWPAEAQAGWPGAAGLAQLSPPVSLLSLARGISGWWAHDAAWSVLFALPEWVMLEAKPFCLLKIGKAGARLPKS